MSMKDFKSEELAGGDEEDIAQLPSPPTKWRRDFENARMVVAR
jgi:hypothetical protein